VLSIWFVVLYCLGLPVIRYVLAQSGLLACYMEDPCISAWYFWLKLNTKGGIVNRAKG